MAAPEHYVGRCETLHDQADPERIARLAATLDHEMPPWPSGTLPPLGHWLCFRPDARQSQLGGDGHPARNDEGFLPNVDLPRRMWAGSRVRFSGEIALDSQLTRTSTIRSVTPKQGRSGAMLFVTVEHVIGTPQLPAAITEQQDIVYREAARPDTASAPASAPPAGLPAADPDAVTRRIVPDTVMLFRYSALTFNAHRIHYDRDYARLEEGYPGLVVHGPLIATLLMDHYLRQKAPERIAGFDFKALAPAFAGDAMTLSARRRDSQVALEAIGPNGVAMAATITLAT